MRRISPHQQAGLFLKPIHGLFFTQPVDARRVKEKLVAYPLAYDYGLFTSKVSLELLELVEAVKK